MLKIIIGVLLILTGIGMCITGSVSGMLVFLLGVLWLKDDEDDLRGGQGEIAFF